jgi:hypothetical protein
MAALGPELLEESRFRCYEGPIGFALDVISQWHKELAFVLPFFMRWKQHRPIIQSSIYCVQIKWSTPFGYLLELRKIEVVVAELSGLLRAPQRRARRQPSYRVLSTGKPRIRQPLYAVKNAPLPVIVITLLAQHVQTWAAKVAEEEGTLQSSVSAISTLTGTHYMQRLNGRTRPWPRRLDF